MSPGLGVLLSALLAAPLVASAAYSCMAEIIAALAQAVHPGAQADISRWTEVLHNTGHASTTEPPCKLYMAKHPSTLRYTRSGLHL